MMHIIEHGTRDDLCAQCRALVEAGAEDGPVWAMRNGIHVLTARSLYRAALLTVSEEPSCRLVAWSPHPNATVGPRIQGLLDARAAAKAARKAAA